VISAKELEPMSTGFGPRGFHYTIGHAQRRSTVGFLGTGLSHTTYSESHARQAQDALRSPSRPPPAMASDPSGGGGLTRLAAMTPPQKIAWGILLTLLLVTSPIGLWLLITGLWQLHVPTWRVRTYVRQAALEPSNAPELLSEAAAIDPISPEVLAPLAELKSAQGDDVAALALYRLYCERVPSDWLARGHLALAALKSNQLDEAITELTAIRAGAVATDDSKASIDAHLSYAYLCREDPQQALALCEPSASRANANAPGSQQCLFYRGVSQYMLGRTGAAVNDVDQLHAINPGYPGLEAVKDAMTTHTYELLLPDGAALVPATPGQITQSAVKVERTAPRSPHCLNCQAPLRVGALDCPYCHAATVSAAAQSDAPPPPPPR
jgi:hypothetical protein